MTELIPSKTVREYIKEKGKTFTDAEKATLVFISGVAMGVSLKTIETELKNIASQTDNAKLKKQIEERIITDREHSRLFWENSEGYLYSIGVKEQGKWQTKGFFLSSDLARDYAKNQSIGVRISKYKIIGYNPETGGALNGYHVKLPQEDGEEMERLALRMDYIYSEVSECYFNENGEECFIDYTGGELSEDIFVSALDSTRFELGYVDIPNPFEKGDRVIDVVTGEKGEIAQSEKSRKQFLKKIDRAGLAPDFIDADIQVEFTDKSGEKQVMGASLIFLEKYVETD